MSELSRPITGLRVIRTFQAVILFVSAMVGADVAMSVWASIASTLGVAEATTTFQILRTVALYLGFIAPVGLFIAAAGDRELLSGGLPTRRQSALIAGTVVALYVGQIVLIWTFSLVDVSPSQNPAIDPTSYAPMYFLVMIPVSLLVVGPAEELLVRGALQGLLKRAWGPWPGILGASALFGSLHIIGEGSGALAYVALTFLLGIVLGYVYEYTGNLVVPALGHGGYNAMLYALQYWQVA